MISIFFFTCCLTYYYIEKYIFFIPLCILYLNYVKNTKIEIIKKSIEDEQNTCKLLIYKGINYILTKPNLNSNFDYKSFILHNKYNDYKFFLFIIKIDNVFILIFNEFLLFILFYLKFGFKYIIANQFTSSSPFNNKLNTNTNINKNTNIKKPATIEEKKKNILDLVNKKYS